MFGGEVKSLDTGTSNAGAFRNVVKIRPPLVFRHDQADLLLNVLGEALAVTRG